MKKTSVLMLIAALALTALVSGCAGFGAAMQATQILASEQPSMELSLVRLRETQRAAELAEFYMKKAPIDKDSTWPSELNNIDQEYANKYYETLHCSGAYTLPKRYVLPIAVYAEKFAEVKETVGEAQYPNFFEAFVAFGGEEGEKVRAQYDSWMEVVEKIAANDGTISELETKNDSADTPDADKKANDATMDKLKEENKALEETADAKFEELVLVIEALGQKPELVADPDKLALAQNLFKVSNNMASIQQQASLSVFMSITQFTRAAQNALSEMQSMATRLAQEAAGDPDAAMEQVKKLFDDVMQVPSRIGALGTLMGKSEKFNRTVADALGKLIQAPAFEAPSFSPMESEFTSRPASCDQPKKATDVLKNIAPVPETPAAPAAPVAPEAPAAPAT